MMSEVEERPRFIMGSYGWHRSQWVKDLNQFAFSKIVKNYILSQQYQA